MLKVLERRGRSDLSVHGFHSTFRDWAAERSYFPNHLVEQAPSSARQKSPVEQHRCGKLQEG